MDETCGIIVIRQREIVGERDDHYLAECILKNNHLGSHLIKTPELRYFVWSNDYACGCCRPDEEDRCYTYGEITPEEAKELLSKDKE